MIKSLTAQDLKDHKDDYLIIDVREVSEHAEESIEGSHLIPLGQITASALPVSDKKIVIHCRSGMRSLQACQKLILENPDLDLYNLEGGILAWSRS